MLNSKETEIIVKPDITAKASPDMKQLKPRAVAGVSKEELIERNVVGEYKEDDEESEEPTSKTNI